MLRLAKSYSSSRNALSPVQRQTSATALGNLTVSSVLKSYFHSFVSASKRRESRPNQFEPSEITSCVTTPEPSLRISDTSRSPRRWSLICSNWPTATLANAVYSPSVANIHG